MRKGPFSRHGFPSLHALVTHTHLPMRTGPFSRRGFPSLHALVTHTVVKRSQSRLALFIRLLLIGPLLSLLAAEPWRLCRSP
jgi:hypothetical protein